MRSQGQEVQRVEKLPVEFVRSGGNVKRHWMKVAVQMICAGAFLFPLVALAQQAASATGTNTPRVDRREARQQRRIQQGARSGELTPRETRRLEREQARIRRNEARAKSDGTVTPQERRRLNRELNRSSRHIRREKHDAQHVN